ncbi:MAG: molybdopterin-binding protein [Bacteroidota bacterium]
MKQRLFVFFLFITVLAVAQEDVKTTESFTIGGQVIKEKVFTITDIAKMPSVKIGDIAILNHLGVTKGMSRDMSVVPVKEFLKDIQIKSASPKDLNECYLVFIASDNYKVVYSWNELFNSPTGDNTFIVTAKEGKAISEMNERILLLSTTDFKTGRRYVKGLTRIEIQRAGK